jgi:hypothetical protein
MGIEFINRAIIITLVLALIAMILVGTSYGWEQGLGVFAGATWGIINLFFIKRLMQSLISQNAKSYFSIVMLFALKFPLLYVLGFYLFRIEYFSPYSLVLGFSLFFLVLLIKGLIVWLFEKDEVESPPLPKQQTPGDH